MVQLDSAHEGSILRAGSRRECISHAGSSRSIEAESLAHRLMKQRIGDILSPFSLMFTS
jgi:hypothetical protein